MFTLVSFHYRPYNLDALSNNDIRIIDIIECSLDWLWAKIVSYIYMLSRDVDKQTDQPTDLWTNKWTDRWMDGLYAYMNQWFWGLWLNG